MNWNSEGGDRSQKLINADSLMLKRSSSWNDVINGYESCPLRNKKEYLNIGLRFSVQHYNIYYLSKSLDKRYRQQVLLLPMKANGAVAEAEDLDKEDNIDAFLNQIEVPPETASPPQKPRPQVGTGRLAKSKYAIGGTKSAPIRFEADLTVPKSLLLQKRVGGFQSAGINNAGMNAFLGKALGIHIHRGRTYKTKDTGNFEDSPIELYGSHVATEKLSAKIFAYVSMKLDSKQGIYEIIDGKLSSRCLLQDEYDKLKRIDRPVYKLNLGASSMTCIPGVQQFHILMEEQSDRFQLAEVYCDGDKIFPL